MKEEFGTLGLEKYKEQKKAKAEENKKQKTEETKLSQIISDQDIKDIHNPEDLAKMQGLEYLITQMTEKGDELLESLKRERADFENYRRRNQTSISEAYATGKGDAVALLLPVLDSFSRAIESLDETDSTAKGVILVYKQMMGILEGAGLNEIPAEGQEFDPKQHNAVMQEEVEGFKSGMVCEVLSRGYKFGERILRHPMVKVSC